jgi:hypothetical protein
MNAAIWVTYVIYEWRSLFYEANRSRAEKVRGEIDRWGQDA